MSIYATLWRLMFPRHGEDHTGCDWVEVIAQGVPAHIGPGSDGGEDPYAAFLPPAVTTPADDEGPALRAVVFVTSGTPKGTPRSAQEYVCPLLVLSGDEYAAATFEQLHERICDALRGDRPRLLIESWSPEGRARLHFEDGSGRDANGEGA